jgi:CRISPR system Cascade subunit CasE
MSLYLSRVGLRRDAPVAAIAPLLFPEDPSERAGAVHRLLWTLFAGDGGKARDFLWRETVPGTGPGARTAFYVLSARLPRDPHGLFRLETKDFAPALAPGDRLAFSLRANPVITRAAPAPEAPHRKKRGKRHDVVMDRLSAVAPGTRADVRRTLVEEAGRDWLVRQGERYGFRLREDLRPLRVDGYQQLRVPRSGPDVRFSVLDFAGVLEVTDPERFLDRLAVGFGKAKAFGCGLMLLRRA